MASTVENSLTIEEVTVVDVDSHADEELQDDVLPYVENRGLRRKIDQAKDVKREIFTSTRPTPPFPTTKSAVDIGEGHSSTDLIHERGADPDIKRRYMKEYGIDHTVVTPQMFALGSVKHDQIAVAIAKAYNEWLSTEYIPGCNNDRIKATILVANHRPDEAAEEIDKWADEDFVAGVQFPGAGLVPPAGHHRYDPIYEAAQDHDLPIVMHSGCASASQSFPVQRSWAQTFVESHMLVFPMEAMWHLGSLLFRGTPERFPDLEWVHVEAGVEWLPWFTWRADDHYLQNSQDVPILTRSPSEYVKDQFYFTTQPLGHTENHAALANAFRAAGAADSIMYASDHPHPDADLPEELFTPLNANLDSEEVRAVMGETAATVFGF